MAELRRFDHKYRLGKAMGRLGEVVSRFSVAASVAGARIEVSQQPASSGDIGIDVEELVEQIATTLAKKNATLALFIDEMQELDRDLLGALLATQHQAAQNGWPFYLFGAGLPNLPAVLSESRSYAERQFEFHDIGALTASDAANAIAVPITRLGGRPDPEAVDYLVHAAAGYPYFLQEYGKALWNNARDSHMTLDDARLAFDAGREELDQGFFPARWDRTTPAERRYLAAIAATGDTAPRARSVAEHACTTSAALSPARDSLIKKGLVWAPEHGRIAFTVPLMDEFIRRQPEFRRS